MCRVQTEDGGFKVLPPHYSPPFSLRPDVPSLFGGGMQATTYLIQHHFFAGATWRARTSWAWLTIFKRYITAELQVGNHVSEMLGVLKHFFGGSTQKFCK